MKNKTLQQLEFLRTKESNLILAYRRVRKLLDKYIPLLQQWEELYSWDFNLLHELEERLQARLNDVQQEFYELHWDLFGYNSYNI